ncbi:MAG: hypothetical protein MUO63_03710 [Desulfobulbaceae bacterium]|nr:hypothetical protein [Desulfobulbaceae bacterium]
MIEFYHGFILRQKIAKCNYLQRILYEENRSSSLVPPTDLPVKAAADPGVKRSFWFGDPPAV